MRIIKSNPNIIENIEIQNINGADYRIGLFFESKDDKNAFMVIPWGIINSFTYADDIRNVGLTGEIILDNISNVFDPILNNTDKFYLGFYSYNTYTNYEENVYFSIFSSSMIGNKTSSTSSIYSLKIEEAFMVEGANRNLSTLSLANGGSNLTTTPAPIRTTDNLQITTPVPKAEITSTTLEDLIEFAYDFLLLDLKIAESGESTNSLYTVASKSTPRIIDVDKHSFEYFKSNCPSGQIGEAIYKNIDDTTSVTILLNTINKNVYFPKAIEHDGGKTTKVDLLIGDVGTARSENLSFIKTNNKNIYKNDVLFGERKITIRNIKDTFTACFQDNQIYEAIINQTDRTVPNDIAKPAFYSPSFIYNVQTFPVTTILINNEWCDCVVAPINQPDTFSTTLYKFNDLVETFEKEYLHQKTKSNISISTAESRGITRKVPPFNDNNVNFAVSARLIRTMFTMNKSIQLSLPGNSYRKANEIIYVDKNLVSANNDKNGTQTTFSNLIESNYYFVTRVVHTFKGQQYSNELFLSSFCNPL